MARTTLAAFFNIPSFCVFTLAQEIPIMDLSDHPLKAVRNGTSGGARVPTGHGCSVPQHLIREKKVLEEIYRYD